MPQGFCVPKWSADRSCGLYTIGKVSVTGVVVIVGGGTKQLVDVSCPVEHDCLSHLLSSPLGFFSLSLSYNECCSKVCHGFLNFFREWTRLGLYPVLLHLEESHIDFFNCIC